MKFRKTRRQKKIQVPPPHPRLNPGADFYRFVNQRWLESLRVPSFISSYGVSEEIETEIQKKLSKIVQRCIERSQRAPDNHENYLEKVERCLGELAHSILDTPAQQTSLKSFQEFLQSFKCIRDKEDVGHTIGVLARRRIGTMLVIRGKYQEGRTSRFRLILESGGLGLPDLSYYEKTAPGKSRTLLHYSQLLKQVGAKFDIPELSSIVTLETDLSSILSKAKREKEVEMKASHLEREWPGIPWNSIFQGYGLPAWKSQTIWAGSTTWISNLEKMFQKLPLNVWRLFFSKNAILAYLPYLPPPFDDIHFDLYRRRLRGQAEKTPQYILCLEVLEDWATPFISRLYIHECIDPSLKKNVLEFTRTILQAAQERIKTVDWFEPETRSKAAKKVGEMDLAVAYPDSFERFPIPVLNSENFFENLVRLGEWDTENQLRRLGQRQEDQKDWDDPVFAVNAYYYTETNEMVLPAGTLSWPFYGEGHRSIGWNYGGLGAIIGHEMTHAFDEDGKEYSPSGELKPWWLPQDEKNYKKKTKALIELFSRQKVLGHSVSGTLTLSENISDLGGLQIAKHALEKELEKRKATPEERKEALRDFFISYAVSWRVKEKPAKILQALFLDHHAPPFLRVNLVVSQFQEWYDVFGVTEKDGLFIPVDQRISIF
jgi:putative endopeptidase